jgi:TRAP transporter 4TM/12TM fusion protein
VNIAKLASLIRILLSLFWMGGQIYIIYNPFIPMIQTPMHLMLALALVILWSPLGIRGVDKRLAGFVDAVLLATVAAAVWYFLSQADRLTGRIEGVDPILPLDVVFGIAIALIVLECGRRAVGWSLNGVILGFLVYAFAGPLFPGWSRFGGFQLDGLIESLTMTSNGLLGITTATSVEFVFYFVAFGAFYGAIGGSQLFIDIGIGLVGRHRGGAAKTAIVASSMMGTVSGSAVANVVATGVFTIPFMRKAGLNRERAAATEAIASTGGQLMPPVMGIAAFVMADLLQMDYGRIALAGIIPALAYYVALFVSTDLHARRTGEGTVTNAEDTRHEPILPRLYLLLPPLILVGCLVIGYSATYSAVMAIFSCVVVAYLRRRTWMTPRQLLAAVEAATRQAAEVAVPIAAIGIIIAVAIESNLALKFSTRLIEISGGSLLGAMFLIIAGCIIMGMGLPTVAAYIIGAILFVPSIIKLGIPELAAHFFVMYYCVLSMVTPPVALASFAAAGLAKANSWKTGILAFKMSMVAFFIPFAFAFDDALLGQGPWQWILAAFVSTLLATSAWAVALNGWFRRPLRRVEQGLVGVAALGIIFSPTGSWHWMAGMAALALVATWILLYPRRPTAAEPAIH